MEQDQIEKHSTARSVILHLLPGFLVGCFFLLVRQPVARMGYPSIIALIFAIAFILIPVELGYLFYQGKKKTGRFTLQGIISYRDPIPWWQYLVWGFVIFIATGAIVTLLEPLDAFLHEKLFFWIPDINYGLDGFYSRKTLIVTYSLCLLIVAFLAPLVEELYFRGYLLPRMKGKYAALFHSFLFAVQHVLEPWMILTRTLGFLPILFGVKKKNIYIGIIVHILCNTIMLTTGIAFIVKMK
jgi:membrane protease YdiL (CAAX protease family)